MKSISQSVYLFNSVLFFIVNAQQKDQRQWYKGPLKMNEHVNNQDVDGNDGNKDLDVENKDRLPERGNNHNNAPDRRRPSSGDDENYLEDSDIFPPSKRERRSHRKKDKHRKHSKPEKKRKYRKTHSPCKKHGKHRSGCKSPHHHHIHHHQHQHHHHHHQNRTTSYRDENNDGKVIDNDRNGNGCEKDRNRERTSPQQPGSRGCNPRFNDEDENSDRNNVNVLDT